MHHPTRLVDFVEDTLVPPASGTALQGESFSHPPESMGVDDAEFLIVRLVD